ncbi:hypothetical protein Thethe_01846 [Thermoanaerobacterium thermosaccharolyticum M0795]|uniref:Uncharacterized protein n=3 Tax=Thermoanaerobacterium thermosaccharolyticum TaxID=1517 RepID=D9TS48_THETC|nr:conserved hypothetical protein [Thermoanaerobacterium thermosaccharolyticum DSM 571]AGB19459.1 hypothetical protein Thethe_01846 [Thermoanaerobacterium thermosaccharolyticum M0795]KAA5807868.1 hypothetical protein F1655_01640 [Thermoanaerobacterium thermosaccharolyticum]TCW39575.1 hypothetical protein EDC21_105135 [Thermohydrogenium kirishiense]MBE0068912.1 hypothetical protein [Thermoanaerobacterium thermosaccharolyticum]
MVEYIKIFIIGMGAYSIADFIFKLMFRKNLTEVYNKENFKYIFFHCIILAILLFVSFKIFNIT